ncbi:outer membrane protein, cobalt-zinc-cadmium efflux system [Granulicella pectinivorans]|uniref:Outer membrane protein, cobalt-zinc-cadmium efflux system n=1 Tax=Granulicella pectinivorans TaxID=474950 RepID=A0A1I6MPA2_9BACT|nr:TolC family protein [Granulicella pectinivorans]SFS17543.1 outer membrane protein, cobalt-zinc-cadmium efflux system [Granulicella pectinivorans]
MTLRRLSLVPILLLALPQDRPLVAQSAAPVILTLDDAITLAERNSPLLQGAEADTLKAKGAARAARAYTNPSLEVFQGKQSARPIATPGVPGLLQHYAAYQPIEIPSERRARQRAADLAIASKALGQRGVALSVIAEAKHAFYDTLHRREEIGHARENLQLVEDLLRRVKVEVEVGEKGRLELTRAEAEAARASFAVQSAQLEYAKSIAALRLAIAAPPDANLDPRGEFEPRITLVPIAEVRDAVLRAHPAIGQSETDIEVSRASLERERALRIPQPTAFAEFENQPDLRFWRAGITVPIPLWDRRRGQIDEAKATISQTTSVLNQRRLELVAALERSYEQYQLADQQATALESAPLRAAESAVDAAKAAYRFGERGIVEVLDAQRVLQSVRGDLLEAQFARQSALVDLEELGAVAPGVKP